MKFRTPANVLLRRAQFTLILAALLPTVLTTPVGIILLAMGKGSVTFVAGILVLAFCTSSLTGYILGSILINRGASLARVQNDFLSSVSHELRTPITSIRLFIETLRDERITDAVERKKCLTILHQEMERLDGLVTKLIDLSRIEAGRWPFQHEPVAVKRVVDDALASFDAIKIGSQVDVEVDVQAGLEVVGDGEALSRALLNLITNAWKYTGERGKHIRVAARASGKQVALEVADNGPGIPVGERDVIFDTFERGQAAVDGDQPGSGLGLAIVRAIVKAHGGKVELQSSGRGALFRILLPRRLVAA